MFISGLGHVLSISGYHMAVVAGVVFFAVRALLALIPALTVLPRSRNGRPWWHFRRRLLSLLSGAEVATQRSFFMTAVVLIAVMVDRRAITFRTLAVAAMIVLVVRPKRWIRAFRCRLRRRLAWSRWCRSACPGCSRRRTVRRRRACVRGGREVAMLLLASLVAGLATTPYSAFHFHRVTPYGVLANLAAMPVVSAVVMPAGMLGLVAAPFGFDGFAGADGRRHRLDDLGHAMGCGAAWRGRPYRRLRHGPLIAASIGIILMGLLRTPLRWSGGLVLAGAIAWVLMVPQPDILISADGHNLASAAGRPSAPMRTGKDAFLFANGWRRMPMRARPPIPRWLTACPATRPVVSPVSPTAACGAVAARRWTGGRLRARRARRHREAGAEGCGAHHRSGRLRRQGALALRRKAGGFVVEAVRPRGFDRPWSPAWQARAISMRRDRTSGG